MKSHREEEESETQRISLTSSGFNTEGCKHVRGKEGEVFRGSFEKIIPGIESMG